MRRPGAYRLLTDILRKSLAINSDRPSEGPWQLRDAAAKWKETQRLARVRFR